MPEPTARPTQKKPGRSSQSRPLDSGAVDHLAHARFGAGGAVHGAPVVLEDHVALVPLVEFRLPGMSHQALGQFDGLVVTQAEALRGVTVADFR